MTVRSGVKRIYSESILILFISLGGGIFAGSVLGTEGMVDAFERIPGLLLLLPAFLATRGNVYGSLGARLASGLHQGLIEPELTWDRRLLNAVTASFINGIYISVFIGLLSWAISSVLRPEADPSLVTLVGIMLLAGLLTSVVMIIGLVILVFAGYRYGLDPDNLVGPIVTTLGDIFGVVFLFVSIIVVGAIV